jgi:hypothetical protein
MLVGLPGVHHKLGYFTRPPALARPNGMDFSACHDERCKGLVKP